MQFLSCTNYISSFLSPFESCGFALRMFVSPRKFCWTWFLSHWVSALFIQTVFCYLNKFHILLHSDIFILD